MYLFIIVNLCVIIWLNSINLIIEYTITLIMIFINKNLNYFYKFFNLYIIFNIFLIEIINAISSIKRNFVLIEFNKIKINSIKTIKVDNLLKNVEIDNNNKRFKDSFD